MHRVMWTGLDWAWDLQSKQDRAEQGGYGQRLLMAGVWCHGAEAYEVMLWDCVSGSTCSVVNACSLYLRHR